MEQAELAALRVRARAAFEHFPGVIAVDIAIKRTGGTFTDELSVKVFVAEKKPPESVPPEELIPDSFEGLPTDVETPAKARDLIAPDHERHSPLIGGITITNFKPDGAGGFDAGTLGFFATLDGVSGPENVTLVSNWHVLGAAGGGKDDTIYQPEWVKNAGVDTLKIGTGAIGKVHATGFKQNVAFTYPGEAADQYHVDCGIAKLDICISSWCHTNCGVSYKNEIQELNIGGKSKLEDVARVAEANVNAAVFKTGATTGRTEGKIMGTRHALVDGKVNVIQIKFVSAASAGITVFADHGDSGAAIVDANNNLIGLLWGGDVDDPTLAYACHIAPVLDQLKVTPITTKNPPVGPAGQARADVQGVFDGINHTIPLRERFLATPVGTEVYDAILAQRAEVVGLVNHRRPVTVAWHRAQGPAFLAHAVENVRDPAHPIPRAIEGIDRATLLDRMIEVLNVHGSEALVAAIAEWREFVAPRVAEADDLHAMVAGFEHAGG